MTAKIDVTLKSGEVLKNNTFFDVEPFFVNYPGEAEAGDLAPSSNTRRRNDALGSVSGLFTLDGSQDELNEDGKVISAGVNFREPRTTRLRLLGADGALHIIAASEVSHVKVYDEKSAPVGATVSAS